MIAGKVAIVCGYGDVGKGSAQALRALGATVLDYGNRSDLRTAGGDGRLPRRASRRRRGDGRHLRHGHRQLRRSSRWHMQKMRDQAIVCNIGHFDNEIDVDHLRKLEWDNIKPQVDHVIFPDGKTIILLAEGRLVNLGCATGTRASSCRTRLRTRSWRRSSFGRIGAQYENKVYVLPKQLDEKVARLHLERIGANLTDDRRAGRLHRGRRRRARSSPSTTATRLSA